MPTIGYSGCPSFLNNKRKAVITEPKVNSIAPGLLNQQSRQTLQIDLYGL